MKSMGGIHHNKREGDAKASKILEQKQNRLYLHKYGTSSIKYDRIWSALKVISMLMFFI